MKKAVFLIFLSQSKRPCWLLKLRKIGTNVQIKGVLFWLVRWAYCADSRDIYSALAPLVSLVKNIFFLAAHFSFSLYRVVRWNQDKSYFLDKKNIKHSFFNRFIWNKKQKVGLCTVFIFYSKKPLSASMMASTRPRKATQVLATMAFSMEAKFSLMEMLREALVVWAHRLVCVTK